MLKAIGQTLFSSGLQNPRFTAQQSKVSVFVFMCDFARNIPDFGFVHISFLLISRANA